MASPVIVSRPTVDKLREYALQVELDFQQFCRESELEYTSPSQAILNQLNVELKKYEQQLKQLDKARAKNSYVYMRGIGQLKADHASRMAGIRHHFNSTINNYHQDLKARLQVLLDNPDIEDAKKAELHQVIDHASNNQNSFLNGEGFDVWAHEEEEALLSRHFKHTKGKIVFAPAGLGKTETLVGYDLKNVKEIAVHAAGRENFAKVTLDKDGKPSQVSFNIAYGERGDYLMWPSPFRKPGASDHTQTFKHSPWHGSPISRDATGAQKLKDLGDQPDVMVEVYEQTFAHMDDLKEREVNIAQGDKRVIKACAAAFIRRGYKVSDQTINALPKVYRKELRALEREVAGKVTVAHNQASQFNIGGTGPVQPNQEQVQSILGPLPDGPEPIIPPAGTSPGIAAR